MIPLLSLFLAEALVFGLFWNNGSAQPERQHESEKPDPAVLISHRRSRNQPPPQAGDSAVRSGVGQQTES